MLIYFNSQYLTVLQPNIYRILHLINFSTDLLWSKPVPECLNASISDLGNLNKFDKIEFHNYLTVQHIKIVAGQPTDAWMLLIQSNGSYFHSSTGTQKKWNNK